MHIIDENKNTSSAFLPDNTQCPKCGFQQQGDIECMKCGIVFAKYDADRTGAGQISLETDNIIHTDTTDRWIGRAGKYAIISLMSLFFFYMVIKRNSWCFLDYINLPFHESGHIMFRLFGETVQFLGGTISQMMWPMILMVYFVRRKEWLSSSFCLFWFGENLLNISKYVADARMMALPLVGGGIHDWNFLLGKWGILHYDQAIAKTLFIIGAVIMTVSIASAFFTKPGLGDE